MKTQIKTVSEALEIIKTLQKVCKNQRLEIQSLKEKNNDMGEYLKKKAFMKGVKEKLYK